MSNDRNEKARQEFQMAQARAAFARAVTAGQTGVVDRFGAVLQTGDSVLYLPPPTGFIWQVKDVGPNLEPTARPGVMKMTLTCEIPMNVMAGQPLLDLLRVIRADATVAGAMGGEADPVAPPLVGNDDPSIEH